MTEQNTAEAITKLRREYKELVARIVVRADEEQKLNPNYEQARTELIDKLATELGVPASDMREDYLPTLEQAGIVSFTLSSPLAPRHLLWLNIPKLGRMLAMSKTSLMRKFVRVLLDHGMSERPTPAEAKDLMLALSLVRETPLPEGWKERAAERKRVRRASGSAPTNDSERLEDIENEIAELQKAQFAASYDDAGDAADDDAGDDLP